MPNAASRRAITVFLSAALASLLLAACHEKRHEAPSRASEAQISVRLFEKLALRQLRVQGPLYVMVAGDAPRSTREAVVQAAGSTVTVLDVKTHGAVQLVPAEGSVRLVPGPGFERSVTGPVMVTARANQLVIVAVLPREDYVAGVVSAEMPDGPLEAQKAQAIVARTYAAREKGRHHDYDFCDLTHCQTFKGVPGPELRSRIAETAGFILQDAAGRPGAVFYSSTCGGHTASAALLLGADSDHAPDGVSDLDSAGRPWCADSPHAKWQFTISTTELGSRLREALGDTVVTPIRIRLNYASSGWVSQVFISGMETPLTGEQFHVHMGRLFGWGKFKSSRFELVERNGGLLFDGEGLGHGVGLCQYGAMAMARAGLTFADILDHYFPGLVLSASLQSSR